MEHIKSLQSKAVDTPMGSITIEGPLPSMDLDMYSFHEHLTAFRTAPKQFTALKKIAEMPEGRIIIARTADTIIGYVTLLYPDPMERWSVNKMKDLMVLGAVEVARAFRGAQVASELINVLMMDAYVENYIIISTEYYWHWDLEGTGLNIWHYRKVLERMMAKGGLYPAATDDPEITSHPANCLMVRIGQNVPEESVRQFDGIRFLRNHQGRNIREGF